MRTAALLLAVFATTACVRTTRDPASGKIDVDVESPTKRGEDWRGKLYGQSTHASYQGDIGADVLDGKTTATIALTGAASGGYHPWHIHEGKCGSGGPIIGDPSAYRPLTVGSDGKAAGSAVLMLQLKEATEYYVNVHQSPSDMGTIVACGQLGD